MAREVFVSYATEDKKLADAVCAGLEERGLRCWIAPRDVPAGASYAGAILDAIEGSRALVLVFSSHANESPHVAQEVERAFNKRVAIVPFRVERVEPARDLEYFISSRHWLDAWEGSSESHLDRLAEGLASAAAAAAPDRPAASAGSAAEPDRPAAGAGRAEARKSPSRAGRQRGETRPEAAQETPPRPPAESRGAGVEEAGAEAASGAEEQERRPSASDLWVDPVLAIRFRYIPPGSFWMGVSDPQLEWEAEEAQRHRVTLTRGFWIGETPVTQGQWLRLRRALPRIRAWGHGDEFPVTGVTWWEAVGFAQQLSDKAGAGCCYARTGLFRRRFRVRGLNRGGFRLPTEAEWEYACRAGTDTHYWSGDGEEDLARVGWYAANSGDRTHPVGEKPANPWGLRDMHGNVSEWVNDGYEYYPSDEQTDPRGDPDSEYKVYRGGCFDGDAIGARSATRLHYQLGERLYYTGFRLVFPSPVVPAEWIRDTDGEMRLYWSA